MARLAFCDYRNMIDILEKYEHNQDFYQIVDSVEASHIRYALTFNPTVYVSHIRQFWSTAKIETTKEGTKILPTVDGKLITVFESSIRRNIKLNDEACISSLPDAELFENLTLMRYNISPNQKFTFQKGQFSRQWKYLIHTIMQCLSLKSIGFNEFSRNIATALVCLATNRVFNISKMIFDGMVRNVNNKVSKVLMYPRQYTRRAKIAQSSALPPVADDPASPIGDDSQGEACPTDSGLEADQDMANIAKTSTLPSDSTPMVTSLAVDEGSMQQKLDELTALCTSLQRQQSDLISKFELQELEINMLKARIKLLEDKDRGVAEQSGDDAPIKGRSLDEGKEAAERVSDDTEEMATVLTSMDAASILLVEEFKWFPLLQKLPLLLNNETVAKYLHEYQQFATELPIGRRIELISDLVKYQDNYAKAKHFKGMALEEIKEKFDPLWKQIQHFILIGSKEETERFKRKGLRLEQESLKKLKTSEEVKATEEVPEEKVKEMMHLVELKRLFEPNVEDYLWTHTQTLMHALVEWKLYDTCGVLHVSTKDQDIFMLIEKDYPLRKGLAIVMINYKLQVENYSQMANDLIMKIYKIANSPRQQGITTGSDEFLLPEQLLTANKDKFLLLIQSDATAEELCTTAEVKE
nr:synaptobrevin, longin-like domain protein [Tanacetum cinerariifolium]